MRHVWPAVPSSEGRSSRAVCGADSWRCSLSAAATGRCEKRPHQHNRAGSPGTMICGCGEAVGGTEPTCAVYSCAGPAGSYRAGTAVLPAWCRDAVSRGAGCEHPTRCRRFSLLHARSCTVPPPCNAHSLHPFPIECSLSAGLGRSIDCPLVLGRQIVHTLTAPDAGCLAHSLFTPKFSAVNP